MKSEFKVIVFVLIVLALVEVAMRISQNSLSIDIAHISTIDRVAADVEKSKAADTTRILFLGNSLTREGVNDALLKKDLAAAGALKTFYVYPDGGTISSWLYAYRQQFVRQKIEPDVLLVLFGKGHLQDTDVNPTVLAQFAGVADIGSVVAGDRIPDVDGKVQFLLSKSSAAYALRERVQPRLFTAIIPHYQESLRYMNDVRNEKIKATAPGEPAELKFTELEALLQITKSSPALKVIFATVPQPLEYDVPTQAIDLIKSSGARFIDLRKLEGLTKDSYPDGYHLGQPGSLIYTAALAKALASALQ